MRPLAMMALWSLLAAWVRTAESTGCVAAAAAVVLAWLLVFLAASEAVLVRRHAFVRGFLQQGGRLARWLGRPLMMLSWEGVKSLAAAAVLLTGLLPLGREGWLVLLLDVPLLWLLHGLLERAMHGQVSALYCAPLARTLAHRANGWLLWLTLGVCALFTPRDDYSTLSLLDALRRSAGQVAAGCDEIALLARVGSVVQGALWWAAQHLFSSLEEDAAGLLLAWLVFVAAFGSSLLFAFSYSRALSGVFARPWKLLAGRLPGSAPA